MMINTYMQDVRDRLMLYVPICTLDDKVVNVINTTLFWTKQCNYEDLDQSKVLFKEITVLNVNALAHIYFLQPKNSKVKRHQEVD
jgi:hypothetical protein